MSANAKGRHCPVAEGDDAGRALYEACFAAGVVNDLRHWDKRRGERDGWTWHTPALDEATKAKWRDAARRLGFAA